jgi:hypothetical protein
MLEITEQEIEQIRKEIASEPRIASAELNGDCLKVRLESVLVEGAAAELSLPLRNYSSFEGATDEQINSFIIAANGRSIRWAEVGRGVMLTAPNIAGAFGLAATLNNHLVKARAVKTPARSAASRANGAKGGRPRKKPLVAA